MKDKITKELNEIMIVKDKLTKSINNFQDKLRDLKDINQIFNIISFELYENLFYQIPKEGDTNSHRYMLERSAEYLGVIVNQDDIQALLDEITSLRQQVLDLQTAMSELNNISNNR